MSGGSMDYLYIKVEDAAFRESSSLRRAFRSHLDQIARALRAIEWNDSGDGDDQEEELLRELLGPKATLRQAMIDARVALGDLQREMLLAEKLQEPTP